MKTNKKLTLKSEKVASMSKGQMSGVKGGGISTRRKFFCGLCTSTVTTTTTTLTNGTFGDK